MTWLISGVEPVGIDVRRRPTSRRGPWCRRGASRTSRRRGRTVRSPSSAAASASARSFVGVVIEVHRLPCVEQHRTRTAAGGRPTPEPRRGTATSPAVSPLRRVDTEHIGGAVRLAGLEHDLARMQQLSALHVPPTVGQPFGEQACGCRSTRHACRTPRRPTRRTRVRPRTRAAATRARSDRGGSRRAARRAASHGGRAGTHVPSAPRT